MQLQNESARERGRLGREKGECAERMFLRAWQNYRHKPRWFLGVRRATRREDRREKTDAVVLTALGTGIRIQVKARPIGTHEEMGFHLRGIVPVGIPLSYTEAEVRIQTLLAIDRFYRK